MKDVCTEDYRNLPVRPIWATGTTDKPIISQELLNGGITALNRLIFAIDELPASIRRAYDTIYMNSVLLRTALIDKRVSNFLKNQCEARQRTLKAKTRLLREARNAQK